MNYCQFRNLTIKRMANAGGGGILPREYQQVEYLENNGNAYIDTGVSPSNDFGVRAVYMQISRVSSGSNVYGTVTRANVGYLGVTIASSGGLIYSWGTEHRVGRTITLDTQYEDSLNYLNNRKYISVYGEFNLSDVAITTASVYLYDFNKNGNGFSTQPFRGRIYEVEFTRGVDTISYYIPCYRKSDNKPGMYDLVTNTFFTNTGTGEFTVGNPV